MTLIHDGSVQDFATCATSRQPVVEWTLRQSASDVELAVVPTDVLAEAVPVTVPGSVLGELIARGVVSDVVVDGNEEALTWISDRAWTYRTEVGRRGDGAEVRLICEGIDTLATVRVDGVVVLHTDDMFHRWVVDLGVDNGGGNWIIDIELAPALPVARAAEARAPLPRADMYELPYNQVRKMACSFGWDWGPVTNTAGLWRAVVLERTRVGRIERALLEGGWDGEAVVHGTVRCEGDVAHISLEVTGSDGDLVGAGRFTAVDGVCDIVLRVPGAAQWNVTGRGDQPLYTVRLAAVSADGEAVDTLTRRLGFRRLELVQSADATGQSFAFHVNGSRVWARGFNWIPADVLPERVTKDRLRHLIGDVVATGANMLRVWGGGVIESDDFFDLCDELGILVWQDFSFACAAYPEDDAQTERVRREVEDAVVRIGYRPSLALWCGCNENLWGYEDWGWKEALGDKGPWGARLYFDVIPEVLAALDARRPYVPGSPFSPDRSAHPNDTTSGTTHHWDTWNQLDYTEFANKRSRFASEFGWQAPSSWPTLVRAIGGEPTGGTDERLSRLQKAFEGAQSLARGITRHFGAADDAGPEWYFKAHVVQARALKASVGHFRSLHDSCSGALWWQFNDCWPGFSWSVEDVQGRRKLSYFAARDVMAPRAVLPMADGSTHALTLVNDVPEAWSAEVVITVVDGSGETLSRSVETHMVPGDGFAVVGTTSLPKSACAVVVDADGMRATRWLKPDRELGLPRGRVSVTAAVDEVGVWRIHVRAESLVRDLVLLTEFHPLLADARVSTQLVDLLPGDEVTFVVTGAAKGAVSNEQWAGLLKADTPLSVYQGSP